MTELGIEGIGGSGAARVDAGRQLRRAGILVAMTVLCGAAYLLGIWTGMKTNVTCATTGPGQIVCSSDGVPSAPVQPPAAPVQEPGSA